MRTAVIYLGGPLPTRSMPPPGERPGRPCVPRTAVLLRIEFTGTDASTPFRGLLPHVSTLAPLPDWAAGRTISVALFLESPPAAVSRYPCPVQPGLSSREPFRASRATALFPHGRHFTLRRIRCQGLNFLPRENIITGNDRR